MCSSPSRDNNHQNTELEGDNPYGYCDKSAVFFLFRPWQAGRALSPDGTQESSRNQESEQSSAMMVPQLRGQAS